MATAIVIILLLVAISGLAVAQWKLKTITRFWKWMWTPAKNSVKIKGDTTGGYEITSSLEGGEVKLSVDVDITALSRTDRDFIGSLVDKMQEQKRKMEK